MQLNLNAQQKHFFDFLEKKKFDWNVHKELDTKIKILVQVRGELWRVLYVILHSVVLFGQFHKVPIYCS